MNRSPLLRAQQGGQAMRFRPFFVRWSDEKGRPVAYDIASPRDGRPNLRAARRLPWPRETLPLSADGWISAAMRFTPPPHSMEMLILISVLLWLNR
jgi:hypothetical protein